MRPLAGQRAHCGRLQENDVAKQLRLPDLALGELEQQALETLWADGGLTPNEVHERVGAPRGIAVNTVCSALKRLHDKGLVARDKVSHAYVYRPVVTRTELQRQVFGALAATLSEGRHAGLLMAFVDAAAAEGTGTLHELEALVAAKLGRGDS